MVARASFLAVQRCVPLSKTRYSRLEEWPGILERIRGFPQRGCFPNGYFVHLSGRRKKWPDDPIDKAITLMNDVFKDLEQGDGVDMLAGLGLDKDKPSHRVVAALIYLEFLLAPDHGRGRPEGSKKWDSRSLTELGLQARAAKMACPELSDREIAELVKWSAGDLDTPAPLDFLKSIEVDTIRKRLPQARRATGKLHVEPLPGVGEVLRRQLRELSK